MSSSSIRRVALVGPVYPWRGDVARFTMHLDRALVQLGIDVRLISFVRLCPDWLCPGPSRLSATSGSLPASSPHFWLHGTNPFTWIAASLRLRAWQPDLLILQWWIPVLAPLIRSMACLHALYTGTPILMVCHNVLPSGQSWHDRMLAHFALGMGTGFLVPNDRERDVLLSVLHHAVATGTVVSREYPPAPARGRPEAQELSVTGSMDAERQWQGMAQALLDCAAAADPDRLQSITGLS